MGDDEVLCFGQEHRSIRLEMLKVIDSKKTHRWLNNRLCLSPVHRSTDGVRISQEIAQEISEMIQPTKKDNAPNVSCKENVSSSVTVTNSTPTFKFCGLSQLNCLIQ